MDNYFENDDLELTRKERWILSNQFLILEALYPAQADRLAHQRGAIENGYELEYEEICQNIYADTLSRQECKDILDVMSMYDAIEHALDAGSPAAKEIGTFKGFDGNNETKQMSYAQYFCSKDRFARFAGREFNSHFPSLESYGRMLQAWRESPDKWNPTEADLARISEARIHPSHRDEWRRRPKAEAPAD